MAKRVYLTLATAKRVADTVHRVEAIPPDRLRQRLRAPFDAGDDITVLNGDTITLPAGAVVWIRSYQESTSSYRVTRAEYGGVSRLAILGGELEPGEEGTAWYGRNVRAILTADYEAVSPGDYLGVQTDSYYAHKRAVGPFLVVGIVASEDQPEGVVADDGSAEPSASGSASGSGEGVAGLVYAVLDQPIKL